MCLASVHVNTKPPPKISKASICCLRTLSKHTISYSYVSSLSGPRKSQLKQPSRVWMVRLAVFFGSKSSSKIRCASKYRYWYPCSILWNLASTILGLNQNALTSVNVSSLSAFRKRQREQPCLKTACAVLVFWHCAFFGPKENLWKPDPYWEHRELYICLILHSRLYVVFLTWSKISKQQIMPLFYPLFQKISQVASIPQKWRKELIFWSRFSFAQIIRKILMYPSFGNVKTYLHLQNLNPSIILATRSNQNYIRSVI